MDLYISDIFYIYFHKNGKFMRLCELRQKEVINTCTCRSLGCPVDLEFDCKTGAITALIVPGPSKFCFFPGRESEYIIPWCCICQIGDDLKITCQVLRKEQEESCLQEL